MRVTEKRVPTYESGHVPKARALQKRLLLVDDDEGIVAAVGPALAAHGYEVTTAADGMEALAAFECDEPDLVLLDLMMPRLGGLEICRRIRESSSTPIIVLSVKGGEGDIVSVLDLGADDYLVKPFRLSELRARISAVLRRAGKVRSKKITCGDLEIDTEKRQVRVAGRSVTLTPIEYALIAELGANAGRVLTTRLLLQRVWGRQYGSESDYVKGVVRRLRVKLEPDPAHPRYIITEPHVGYRLDDAPETPRSDDAHGAG
jgi:two-component system KDP operon response regulator KdpE